MKIIFSKSPKEDDLISKVNELVQKSKAKGLMILACEQNEYTPKILNPFFRRLSIPVFGGLFPGVIYKDSHHTKGFILVSLDEKPEVHVLKDISNSLNAQVMTEFFTDMETINTIMVFVDGFAQKIGSLIETLFVNFGLEYNYIGGGAGSLSMEPSPCIISNEGLLTDAAVLTGCRLNGGIGVNHGWKSIAGPFKVTGSENSLLVSLDFKSAFEVYSNTIQSYSNEIISKDNFFEIAKKFPFGISKLDSEPIVRDPISVDNYNNIVCVGEVPEGSYVHILHGEPRALISATRQAMEQSMQPFDGKDFNGFHMFIDCISRMLFLEKEFDKELKVVNNPKNPLFGALTIGEIANSKSDYLEFYNKTSVVGSFNF